ncbi:hypothetical protein AB4Y84_20825, partial [Stenotrophomonas sp. 2YAF22]|uniref:hypothetical protein n=1 Tax=Stenotrophomonas sp. 2YAF22 TaxID=3233028 RepID=UPI003F978945
MQIYPVARRVFLAACAISGNLFDARGTCIRRDSTFMRSLWRDTAWYIHVHASFPGDRSGDYG